MQAKSRPKWTIRVLTPERKVHTITDTANKAVERLLRLMYNIDTYPKEPFLSIQQKRRLRRPATQLPTKRRPT